MPSRTFKTLAAAGALLLAAAAFAADYSGYSLQELSRMRGTMMNRSLEEREAFRNAWREKVRNASPEERSQYAKCRGKGRGNGQYGGGSNADCDGSGHGHGYGHK